MVVQLVSLGRGLRQGDPLSPMLSIIAEEMLCRGLSDLRNKGFLKGIIGPGKVVTPLHFLYVDAVLIFMNVELKGIKNLKRFLDFYQYYSGQQINPEKNKIFLGLIPLARKQRSKEVLNIPECHFLTRYLGVDLFEVQVKKDLILPLMDKFMAHLTKWKAKLLTLAERVELVKTVMSSILGHNFLVYLWPASPIAKMERWIRNFIWSGEANKSKAVVVNWEKVCKPKREGGLGICRLKEVNLALLAKLCWYIKTKKFTLAAFLRGRFAASDGSLKHYVASTSIFPGIRKVWEFVLDNSRWAVGDASLDFGMIFAWGIESWKMGASCCGVHQFAKHLPVHSYFSAPLD
ncbi:uncharacterized protein LOC122056932 [Macadamia integrifolia]|uniref:uncharacterized protein LOC122056932 n=1 Tax=Macadamia integrifolia TaxID=60698 RepID=UPI001C528332|nr:uncharacterized protein LOC122056932 [Macadamia integrifolia]